MTTTTTNPRKAYDSKAIEAAILPKEDMKKGLKDAFLLAVMIHLVQQENQVEINQFQPHALKGVTKFVTDELPLKTSSVLAIHFSQYIAENPPEYSNLGQAWQ